MINKSHGGNIWQYPKSQQGKIIDFSVNTNPLGMDQKIRKSIIRHIGKINYYPDPESKDLKNRLAKLHRLSSHNFLLGNGSIELIHLIPRALKAKVVLIPVPTFSEYEFAAKANNAKCLCVKCEEKNNFKIEISFLTRHIPKASLIFLCNPNNPTGSLLGRPEILSLLEVCKKNNAILVIDEAFMDFVGSGDNVSMVGESAKTKNLLVLRSLTKIFVLPGIRIGYVSGHKDTIAKLSRYTYPWNVNTLAQIITREAINDKEYMARTQRIIPKERSYLYENLNKIRGVKVYPSVANFFLCKLEGVIIKNARDLSEKLMGEGILVRNCANFRGLNNRFFRIAVKNREANIKLISALQAICR
ncbi:MAG: threonine-phosphate decarboxylase CobD [Candidatus Omnitrophota bacterium]|nr:threonine-phosphate decarboxylase CobD [Candidatus Omnitrophota bacterium]